MSDTKDFFKALGLFLGVPVIALLLYLVSQYGVRCADAIRGNQEATGAKVLIDGQFVGVMEKFEGRDGSIESRLCRPITTGASLLVRKDGYLTFTASMKPFCDDSSWPICSVWIKLVPLPRGETENSP
jgi:hypothetical protein